MKTIFFLNFENITVNKHMTDTKNLNEYVAQSAIARIESGEKELLDKIRSSKALRLFVQNVSIDALEEYAHFRMYSLSVHRPHHCKIHNITYTYDQNPGNESDWYTGDTEFEEDNEMQEFVKFPKVLPCCRDQEQDSDAEESE